MREESYWMVQTPEFSQPSTTKTVGTVNDRLQRLVDILVSSLGLLMLGPLFLWIAFKIRKDSPGPIFYRGQRVGRSGKIFQILKFRTMFENADSYNGAKVTAKGDARITPFGRWLRDSKINELPQLVNVLKGEMSLVGPRPEDPEIAARWPAKVREELLAVRPGITSPASIVYRNEEDLLTSSNLMDDYLRGVLPSKLRLDQLYVRRRNLITDLDVIFWTAIALLPRLGKREIPHNQIFWGPLARFSSRHLAWFLIDLPIAYIAIGISGVLWRTAGPLELGIEKALVLALINALMFSIANILLGLNAVQWSIAPASDAISLALSAGVVVGIQLIINELPPTFHIVPPAMVIIAGLLSFFGFAAARYRSRIITGLATRWLSMRHSPGLGEPVLIVGAGEGGRLASWLLRNTGLANAFQIIGIVDDDPRKHGMVHDGCRILGGTTDIPAIVKRHDVGLVLFAISRIDQPNRERILEQVQHTPARCLMISDFLDTLRNDLLAELNTHRQANKAEPVERVSGFIAEATVDQWLSELENLATNEDKASLTARLEQIRQEMHRLPRS